MSAAPVISGYLDSAMARAHYELIDGGATVYAEIASLPGVYATAATVEECRAQLGEVLEEWLLLGLAMHHPIPSVVGISREDWLK